MGFKYCVFIDPVALQVLYMVPSMLGSGTSFIGIWLLTLYICFKVSVVTH